MLVTIEKGSTWLYNNGKYSSKVKVIKVVGERITFKDDLEWYRQSCKIHHFLQNSKFLKPRKRYHNQKINLPDYFEVNQVK